MPARHLARTLDRYDYSVPKELVAQKPVNPRDAARLLVYRLKDRKIFFDTFRNLANYMPKGAVLVFNETKVIPARLYVTKETGGKVEILFVEKNRSLLKVLANRKLSIGSRLAVTTRLYCTVTKSDGRFYFLKPSFPLSLLDDVFERYGHAPLPPYIKPSASDWKLREQYQTVFARQSGSIAAPTASLHFTKGLLDTLEKKGFTIRFVTLHVGLGTFAPVTEEHLRTGKLHAEQYQITASTARLLTEAKKQGRPIIAVGTTVARTLESASTAGGSLKPGRRSTTLFIREGYRFKFVDGLVTNFHVPRSSLMMLVAALCSRSELLMLYRKAMKKNFRFFSFGDGMLLLPG